MQPTRLGGYELREVLGEGGMGTVYRAHDPTLDRPAAVKVIHPKSLSREGKDRFLREARACSKLSHPNVITVYAAGEEEGTPYMAMELIDGRTLRAVIEQGALDWRTSTQWVVHLLDALQRLHAEGIVHRDLKPENIMVTRDGVVKLMDFGLAHLTTETALTQEGMTLGTVPYMSPEQVMGRKLDARSDLFSLATIFHELLTGAHPFRGEHPMAVMYSIRNETPKPLKMQSGEFPLALQSVLDRAFQKEPDKRFADANAFRDAILAAVPDLGGTIAEAPRTSPLRLALLVGIVATVVFGTGLTGWNLIQGRRAAANRTAATNLNELGQSATDPAERERYFREAIQRDSGFALPYNNLGWMAMERGERAEADSMFHIAARLEPSLSAASLGIGNLYFDTQPDSAEAWYRQSMAGDSPAPAHNQLGALMLAHHRFDEAREVLDAGLALDAQPGIRGFLLKNRGKAAAAQGDTSSAMTFWREAFAIMPGDTMLQRVLGERP